MAKDCLACNGTGYTTMLVPCIDCMGKGYRVEKDWYFTTDAGYVTIYGTQDSTYGIMIAKHGKKWLLQTDTQPTQGNLICRYTY